MRTCPTCGSEYIDEVRFCARDGTALRSSAMEVATKRCPKCGQSFLGEVKFCPRDGMKLEDITTGGGKP